jgi:hypothetical protein
LSGSLNNLAIDLADAGWRDEAERFRREARRRQQPLIFVHPF